MKQSLGVMLACVVSAIAPACGADTRCADAECSSIDDAKAEGEDEEVDCKAAGAPTYESFGKPFMARYCLLCHSSKRQGEARMHAPLGVNFDTRAEIRAASDNVYQQVVYKRTMPVTGGVSDAEREELAAWLDCGAPKPPD
jgi:uncharacterized membrane protein